MNASDREKLTDIWDAFERAGFQYASHRGGVHQLEEMRDQRQDHLPIRKNILQDFLNGKSDLETFQSDMVTQAANTKLWGFSGGGGRFFNQLIASADLHDEIDLEHLLQKILAEPGEPETAADCINELGDFVEHVRPQIENIYEAPQAGFVPYFLSYFWQLHEPDTYPIYYKSMRDALADLDVWEPSGDLAEDYLEFWEPSLIRQFCLLPQP